MKYTKSDVIQFVRENDIRFAKLAFCDVLGNLKNISIVATELDRAFDKGVYIKGSLIAGYENHKDLVVFPDPSSFCILPWRPQQGRVIRFFCDIMHTDEKPLNDFRANLKQLTEEIALSDYNIRVSAEIQFYMLKTDDKGCPLNEPFDRAGYLETAPVDKGENIRREICLTLEDMGIIPLSSRHDRGAGQYVIEITPKNAYIAADHAITFKSAVQTVAAANGLFACFDTMPLKNSFGNEMKINIFIDKNGKNIFNSRTKGEINPDAASFVAGVLSKLKDITAFACPNEKSYERLKMEEMLGVGGLKNIIRTGDYSRVCGDRLEIALSDSAANPHALIYLLLKAGLEGVKTKIAFPPIPESLAEAKTAVQSSKFISKVLSKQNIESYLKLI